MQAELLQRVNTQLGVNLEQDSYPVENELVRSTAESVLNWMQTVHGVKPNRDYLNHTHVVGADTQKQVYIAHRQARIQELEALKQQFGPMGEAMVAPLIKAAQKEIENAVIPPAMVITISGDNPQPAILFVNPAETGPDYDGWSFNAAVAEEFIHLHSKTAKLVKDQIFDQSQRNAIEELAVKWYVHSFLTAQGNTQDATTFAEKVANPGTTIQGSITLWDRIMTDISPESAHAMYFNGALEKTDAMSVQMQIYIAVQEGLVR